MAAIPFIDTHFHLHDMKHPTLRYGWLERDASHRFSARYDSIKPPQYDIEDYIAEIRFANVPKAIHVEAAVGTPDPVDETAWLQALADKHGYPQGIVAECHLRAPGRGGGASSGTCSTRMCAASAISAAATISSIPTGSAASGCSASTTSSPASTPAPELLGQARGAGAKCARRDRSASTTAPSRRQRDDAYFQMWRRR